MLTARADDRDYVEAPEARRGEAYRCRECGAGVILKAGPSRAAHFAHRPDGACAFGGPMSSAHLAAQRLLAEALRARGLEVTLEAPLTSAVGDRRIDVLTWPPERPQARVAMEVQASELTAEAVAARTASYAAMGVAPLWLRLMDFGAFPAVQTLPARGTAWIERYRARAWERWVHDHLGGRLWFMDSGTGLLWRGLFVPAHRHRERAALARAAGETVGRAADWTAARQWVDLELDGPFAPGEARLRRGVAAGPDGQRRPFARFAPAGDTEPDGETPVRARFRGEANGASRHLEVLVDGRWLPAATDGARSDWRTRRPAIQSMIGLGPSG